MREKMSSEKLQTSQSALKEIRDSIEIRIVLWLCQIWYLQDYRYYIKTTPQFLSNERLHF